MKALYTFGTKIPKVQLIMKNFTSLNKTCNLTNAISKKKIFPIRRSNENS